jgi:signal transduction histidine kinase
MARFQTRARAVDMLGRQQIAGIPTAISELFKNAHDAYADNAVVDFFRSDRLLVLRDDGIGMTETDYEQRWLTLGTESKASVKSDIDPPPRRPGYRPRAVLGEKGIGRLAIAAIGPQLLMLSRPLREDALGDLLVSFVHWGLFEFPSVNLEEIEIPTVTLPGGALPSKSDVGTVVDWVEENVKAISRASDSALVRRIRDDLENFRSVDPSELAPVLGNPSLVDGPGTHFYIRPSSELLIDELSNEGDQQATPLRRMLVGFANTMTPGHREPALVTAFRDHFTEDAFEDVISEAEFFTPAEFEAADHHITGRFDEYGQFSGSVSVYGGQPETYTVAWPNARGSKARCGSFDFNLAYIQGVQRESKLDPAMWAEVSGKLNRYGGLYIYRDGIRVLPYGNSDFDFLDIEVRRAKSASDAFFSYRRMFGVVELTRARNSELREKAGREGFADNQAYRQFREILMHFLYQVAVDFFRESGTRSERFHAERSELTRLDKARVQRLRQTRVRRGELTKSLETFFASIDAGRPEQDVADLVARLEGRVASAATRKTPSAIADELVDAEAEARSGLQNLVAKYEISRPRGVGLTRTQTKAWLAYENERARIAEDVLLSALQNVEATIASASVSLGVDVDRRLRFDAAIDAAVTRSREDVRLARRELDQVSKGVRTQAQDIARSGAAAIETLAQEILARAARTDVANLTDTQFVRSRTDLEDELFTTSRAQAEALRNIASQLASLAWPDGSGSQVTPLDELEALETDLDAMREQAEQDLELVQLGAAIEVINHEFQGTINSVRRSLRRIKSWSDANPGLREPYNDLRASFEHLDGYLRLFTPFHRRLYRSAVEIAGSEIEKYLRDVFDRRLSAGGIDLTATKAFADYRVAGYPSVLYPVFVNLVDNAIFWLTDYRGQRQITLDAQRGELIVRDSGPGVPARDHDDVFDFGFSRKPGGTGYGLYISRQVLGREGWKLRLSPSRADGGAEFVLAPPGKPKRGK